MKTLRNHVISKIIITLLILGLLGCGLYTDRQIMLTVICIGIVFLFVFEIVSVLCFTFFAPLLLDMMLLFSCNDPSLYFYICWNKLGRYHEKKREKMKRMGMMIETHYGEEHFQGYLSKHRVFRYCYESYLKNYHILYADED